MPDFSPKEWDKFCRWFRSEWGYPADLRDSITGRMWQSWNAALAHALGVAGAGKTGGSQ
jgi:hypothetical protein